jgi:integrase
MASIQKRVRNGRISYSVRYRSPDGRSRRRDFTRRGDASRFLHEVEDAKQRNAFVDPMAGRVEVVEAATEVNGKLVWGWTKTGERRTVPLPRFLATQLGAYLADRPHGPADLVFGMPQGGPLRASKWGERYFRPAVAAAGLPEGLRVHDLRHTAASLAIRENASVKIVQAMLGHRSATQTLDRYGHLYPSDLDALAERLDQAHAAAMATEVWPHGGPDVVQIRKRPGH